MCVEAGHDFQVLELSSHLRTQKERTYIFVPFRIVLLHRFKISCDYFAVRKVRLHCLQKP